MNNLLPPLTYQGGKQRIASQIIDHINPDGQFHDLCCGSGAISIELINRGHDPKNIVMLDWSPWGLFWKAIGEGTFNVNLLLKYINDIPVDPRLIQSYIKELSKQPADIDTIYVYLLLQASSFGGKSIWIKDNKWQNCSFRSYWEPTATSNRRSHVNPMMPMPKTLFERVVVLCEKMVGIKGLCQNIKEYIPENGIVYIDPPYKGTTFYGNSFNLIEYINNIKLKTYVSEGCQLSEKALLISNVRKKGGISGDRQNFNEEWLNEFNY